MTLPVRLRIMVLILPLAVQGFAIRARGESSCADFLAVLHHKDSHLQFEGCKQRSDLQGNPLEATYRVEGRHAAAVENLLRKEFHIKRVHRTCCVWESTQNSFRDKREGIFVISMSTEETKVNERGHWSEIPIFDVIVDHYPEAP